MIGHLAELWLALFAAFAAGSLMGWLVFRWIDRSDYAFDQRELSAALGRSQPQQYDYEPPETAEDPETAEEAGEDTVRPAAVALLESPRPASSPAAATLRERVRASTLAASWRAARSSSNGDWDEEAIALPAPTKAIAEAATPNAGIETESAEGAEGKSERRQARRPGRPGKADEAEVEGAWEPAPVAWPPAGSEGWVIPDTPALPAPGKHGPDRLSDIATVFRSAPAVSEIWPSDEDEDREADPDVEAAAELLTAGTTTNREPGRPPTLQAPPADPDDLKQIKGIGAAFEKRLNRLGIYHHRQIAEWTAAEQAWIGEYFGFTGRIERDDWTGQAMALVAGEATREAKEQDPPTG